MTIKIKDIQLAYNVPANMVKQVKSMQLFIVDTSYLGRILVSYKTPIGVFHNSTWYLTTQKFSATTSKQTNIFAKSTPFKVERISAETFDDLLMAIGKV